MSSRVKSEDQTKIDLQSKKRQVNSYIKRLSVKVESCQQTAIMHVKQKNKLRAVIALKLKKMYNGNIDKANGMIAMIEKTISNLEAAIIDNEVINVLKDGDKVIKELQSTVSIEDLQNIKEDTEQAMELNNQIAEYLSANHYDESSFITELEGIENDQIKEELDSAKMHVPTHNIEPPPVHIEAPAVQIETAIPVEEKQMEAA